MRSKIFAVTCLLLMSAPAAADPLDDGLAAYDAKQYDRAVMLLTPIAEAGTIEAQLALGNIYNFGFGVPADQAVALRWFAKAGEQGSRDALYNAGAMTLHGVGTKPDQEHGVRMLQQAAKLGNSDALYELGVASLMYDAPRTGDVDTGLGYLAEAVYLGNRRAPAMVGVLLQELPEVPNNLVKSALNFQVAIARGCDDLDDEAAAAVARLSAEERASYDYNLPTNLAMAEANATVHYYDKAHCLL